MDRLVTAWPVGFPVSIKVIGTRPNIAQAIRHSGADDFPAVEGNQPTRAGSIGDLVSAFGAALPSLRPDRLPACAATLARAEILRDDHQRADDR
ncbi:hypothetical protein [Accumulibacter sp.]|uniref:hypothetical protein n=1 Tax=Accumulibacter sp. TaxID=2053492 RepID=UPI0025D8F673|nr:hypothetical protein [Accumulibacter sp.]MCM8611976.1 hypothetical protein [Accumulibacter sp.]MCM8635836.1 hypothetical protein [Accumulibacter sp.]MCM8641938.1 hypothetical protein [Accumulibacter sp.]